MGEFGLSLHRSGGSICSGVSRRGVAQSEGHRFESCHLDCFRFAKYELNIEKRTPSEKVRKIFNDALKNCNSQSARGPQKRTKSTTGSKTFLNQLSLVLTYIRLVVSYIRSWLLLGVIFQQACGDLTFERESRRGGVHVAP
ncbi:serine/threonine-protein kinase SBK1 [Striga asiatica]|uniref:Serine/threonine-protein kinase SBK1 n=1 Tax=Striga asiatica TaxID=4170 RepID=A0A5A7QME0_STRAF|nr:serine/threonine-protein kinase SBK1 [Striga asiatica]